jgi:hypothetical protein
MGLQMECANGGELHLLSNVVERREVTPDSCRSGTVGKNFLITRTQNRSAVATGSSELLISDPQRLSEARRSLSRLGSMSDVIPVAVTFDRR